MSWTRPSRTTVNILANLISKFWIAGANVIFLPIYVNLLGIDSYGLVGFYTTLVAAMTILDFGLSMTINRELAKSTAAESEASETRSMVFTIEVVYLLIGFLIGISVFLFSTSIARNWLTSENLPASVIDTSIKLMGVVLAFQWPISLYSGGLFGLQRQALCGILDIVFGTLRLGGAVIVLKYFDNTIAMFFIWQALINMCHLIFLRIALWSSLPAGSGKVRFSTASVSKIRKFTLGISAISLVSFGLAYADKIVVSKMATLETFAYYAFASSVAGGIGQFGGAITSAIFPKFSALSSASDSQQLIVLYHKSCRLMASLVFPIATTVIIFAPEILKAWTKNDGLVANTTTLARILTAGTALNCLMHMPYYLMLSKGITRFTVLQNLLATIIVVPLLFLLISKFGVIGASSVWLILNLSYVLISLPLVHKIIMPGETAKWYLSDTLAPMAVSLFTVGSAKALTMIAWNQSSTSMFVTLLTAAVFCIVSILVLLPGGFMKNIIYRG